MRKSILNILAFLGGAVLLSLLSPVQVGRPGPDFSLQASLLVLLGGLAGVAVRFWLLQRWKSREREANLALVVRTVRRIHLLLAEGKGRWIAVPKSAWENNLSKCGRGWKMGAFLPVRKRP